LRIVIASIIIALSVSGCGSSDEEPVGNPATFERINALTSCASLRAELDQFFDAHDEARDRFGTATQGSARRDVDAALAYIEATAARMEEAGC
jgi:hypothetical protein